MTGLHRGYAMSPLPTATREQSGGRPVAVQPFPTADLVRILSAEIVVDWQMSDEERKG